jgi:cysteinyl-tRNA synthetase
MSLRLKNTYTKTLEVFAPLDPDGCNVTMYTCGPTVYSFAHIGNFRSFLFADLLRRVLERRGYRVRQVMNITDVGHMTEDHLADAEGEDKLAVAARKLGSDPYKVAEYFERAFAEDAATLRLRVYLDDEAKTSELHPRATQYVPEMLAMIQRLLERGYAYVDASGQVYFQVSKFAEYGKLSGKRLDELETGARVAVREEKRDPRDFALWKVDPKHLMQWDPAGPEGWPEGGFERLQALLPNGMDARVKRGFPGWHIECSAMARALLGEAIDIHTGGEDNIFPHHECEIAQSFGAFGTLLPAPAGASSLEERKTFARFWIHGRHLLVNGAKMSKRDGTFFTVRDLLDPAQAGRPELAQTLEALGFAGGRVGPATLRYALTAAPYTQPMNFTTDLLVQARASIDRLQTCFEHLRDAIGTDSQAEAPVNVDELARLHVQEFDAALDDNLNMSRALAAVFGFVTAVNQAAPSGAAAARSLEILLAFDAVLEVLDRRVRTGLMSEANLNARAQGLDGAAPLLALPPGSLDAQAIEGALALRRAAKSAKNYRAADGIRDELRKRGVLVEDLPQGVRWKLSD